MTAVLVTTVALLAVLVPCMVAKLRQVRRDRDVLELWAIGAAVAFLTLGQALIFTVEFPAFGTGLSDRTVQLGASIAVIGAYAALQLFYLSFIARFLQRHRVRVEIALFLVVLGATVYLLAVAIPGDGRVALGAESVTTQPGAAAFFLLDNGYIAYVLVTQLYWTQRYLRRFSDRIFRAAAVTTAIGSTVLLAFVGLRMVFVVDSMLVAGRFGVSYEHEAVRLMVPVGSALLALGLTLPVLLAQAVRIHQWIGSYLVFRRLNPLSRAVVWAFPELVRPQRPGGPGDGARRRRPALWLRGPGAFRLEMQLRLTHCRDGYTRLLPYLDGEQTPADRNARAGELARTLRAGGRVPPAPVGDDVGHLCEISQELKQFAPTGQRA